VDAQEIRSAALAAAAEALSGQMPPSGELTAYADTLIPWIAGTVATWLDVTVIVGSHRLHSSNGGTMATTASVTDTSVTIVSRVADSAGNFRPDAIAWASDDTGGQLLAGDISADTWTWTGTIQGKIGTVTVTATSPTASPPPPASVITIDLQAGPAAQIISTVTVQP
jgi:hypothetical protein